jgi:hypothetical protein
VTACLDRDGHVASETSLHLEVGIPGSWLVAVATVQTWLLLRGI